MCDVLVFAGTTEGRKIAEFLNKNHVSAHICVATEYGETLLPEGEDLSVSHERLTMEEMCLLIREKKPQIVIDATHPYAAKATENIREACKITGAEHQRLLRNISEKGALKGAVYVSSSEEAVEYLKNTTGNILVTTGSKELVQYTKLPDFQNRVYARVLSLGKVVSSCEAAGFSGKHLICMQGPFTTEINVAMIRMMNCTYLVTKMSGAAGGYQEKIDAAMETGCIPVVIGAPMKEEGISLVECRKILCRKFSLSPEQEIALVGIGTGNRSQLTLEAQEVLEKAELIIGARRMVEAVLKEGQDSFIEYKSDRIVNYINSHPEYEKIAIVLSGDIGFYSGAKNLLLSMKNKKIRMVCGISSMVYFMGRTGESWDDVYMTSAHGREDHLLADIRDHEKVFAIMGSGDGVSKICKKLVRYGMKDVIVTTGECLSYENESIKSGTASDFVDGKTDPLCVVMFRNVYFVKPLATHGLPDDYFVRDQVPMTKEEVRSVSLSKLRLTKDAVCYDVGAGTGSVSVEMAVRASHGKVYAIEKKPLAVEILKRNKQKAVVDNMEIIEGTAPDAMMELEPPTHAFIGGSSGNMRKIMELLLRKNPSVRMVINCIAMETVSETLECVKSLPVEDVQVITLSVARSKQAGPYHMMMGENPITIISCSGKGEIR